MYVLQKILGNFFFLIYKISTITNSKSKKCSHSPHSINYVWDILWAMFTCSYQGYCNFDINEMIREIICNLDKMHRIP